MDKVTHTTLPNSILMGRTISKIAERSMGSLTSPVVSKSMVYFPFPDNQMLRIDILKELWNVMQELFNI